MGNEKPDVDLEGETVVKTERTAEGTAPGEGPEPETVDYGPEKSGHTAAIRVERRRETRYEVVGPLGKGGMGVTSLAHDRRLSREVALKVLRPDLRADPAARQRFLEEAVVLASLDHPGTVPVFDAGTLPDGSPFCVMKRVKGQTLRALLAARPAAEVRSRQGIARMADLFEKVCQAVAAAHGRGVVHRDLKPENVMVDDLGAVYVVDWGLAIRLRDVSPGAGAASPAPGEIAGTPAYMSPEQVRGASAEVGPRSDVFSLGAVLYEMLTGVGPFAASDGQEAMKAVLDRTPPDPRHVNRSVPRPLAAICRKALCKEPSARYETARALADDVQRFRELRPVLAAPPTLLERLAIAARWRPALSSSLATLVALALVAGAAAAYHAAAARRVVASVHASIDVERREIGRLDAELATLRADRAREPSGSAARAALEGRIEELSGLRRDRREHVRALALALAALDVSSLDGKVREIVREETRDRVESDLSRGEPLRARLRIDRALRAYRDGNPAGLEPGDVAWLEEQRARVAAGGAATAPPAAGPAPGRRPGAASGR